MAHPFSRGSCSGYGVAAARSTRGSTQLSDPTMFLALRRSTERLFLGPIVGFWGQLVLFSNSSRSQVTFLVPELAGHRSTHTNSPNL